VCFKLQQFMGETQVHRRRGPPDPDYMIFNNQKKSQNDFIVSIKDKHGKSVFKEEGKRQVIRDYCSEMFSSIVTNSDAINNFLSEVEPLDSVIYETLIGKIKREEVESVINQLSTDKTPGLDGLPSEFYKIVSKELSELLTEYFNEGIERKTMGKSFYEGVMCLLYKKGDREDINNYRQLTIMDVDYKIFAKIIMSRLEDVLDSIIEKEQTCAIKGRLMWDNLSMLREIIYNGKDSELCILRLDQRRAFDSVSHSYLWKVMKAYNFPDQFISIIQLIYKKSLVQVKVNGKLSSPFSAECGVKQGCPLSAALYVLAINPLLKRINDDKRIKGYVLDKSHKIAALAYADDVTVIIRNQNLLSSVMEILHRYEQASGAKLNHDKTEG
uniref:Reverse transcriptase domain-containing protein n=1 Tax=Pundamilia nyererei TaxID=303518 RepID=A0A3B4F097_9CICH